MNVTLRLRGSADRGWSRRFPGLLDISAEASIPAAADVLLVASAHVDFENRDHGSPLIPEEIVGSEVWEGAVEQVQVNRFERDPRARALCLATHGFLCRICETDMERTYGAIGRQAIHVHHLTPLAAIGRSYRVDGARDLLPVCPNCHAMLHRRTPPYTPEDLRAALVAARRRDMDRS